MSVVLVSGGWLDSSGECWIDRVSPSGRERLIDFLPPDLHRVPAKGFTGLVYSSEGITVCTFNAIWRFRLDGSPLGRLHLPHLNDLHGLAVDPDQGDLLVCNTGLDSIERFSADGMWRGRYALTPTVVEVAKFKGDSYPREAWPDLAAAGWDATPITHSAGRPLADGYYDASSVPFFRRRVRDFRHPNHIYWTPEHGWCATLLLDRSAVSLRTFDVVERLPGPPHDGVPEGEVVWFTTVDGEVIRSTSGVHERYCGLQDSPVRGWCRGLALTQDHVVVGVTTLRTQRMQVPWSGGAPEATSTAVVFFRRDSGRYEAHVPVGTDERVASVFALVGEA